MARNVYGAKGELFGVMVMPMLITSAYADIYSTEYEVTYGCDLTYGTLFYTFNNILSVTECCWRCNEITQCVSVKYDPINTACHLNSYRRPPDNRKCQAMVEYAALTKSSGRMLINENCVASLECSVPNSRCSVNKCQCKPGYSYKYRNESCVTACYSYGITFARDPDEYGLQGKNDKCLVDVHTAEACMQACVDETTFECRSCEYMPSLLHCHLSKDTAMTAPSLYIPMSYAEFYHRNCQ